MVAPAMTNAGGVRLPPRGRAGQDPGNEGCKGGSPAMELLERTAFLDTLAEYAAEARRGDGRLVLVSGESGTGKTVLLKRSSSACRGPAGCGAAATACSPRP